MTATIDFDAWLARWDRQQAGFAEAGVLWQYGDERVLAAVR